MRHFFSSIFLLCAWLHGSAQEEFVTPSRKITGFPFIVFTGGVIVLQARLDDFKDTLNFILDTGSGGISLDSGTAAYFGLKPEPSERLIRGIAGIKKVSFLYNRKLQLPGLTVDSLNFHVNDYTLLTSVYGERIDGIIGYSLLSRYILKINYDSAHIEFWTNGSMKYPKGGHLLRPAISTLPVQTMRIKDHHFITSRFLYDMGAGLNMMLSADFIRDSSVLLKRRKLYAKQAEGLGGKIDMNMTVLKEVKLGPYKFRDVPIYIFDDTYNVTSYPYLGGILGSDILRRFNIILNYDKRQIHLLPNTHFGDNFDYSYSGIELYAVNETIIIGDVAKNSPAEKIGLHEGDELLAVNTNFSGNLQSFKTALQQPGHTVKLIVRREGKLMEFYIKIRSIL